MFRSPFKTRKPEKKSKRWYESELDELVRFILRLREPFCVTCGVNWNLEVSHLFGRAMPATRYDIDPEGNNHMQCQPCNRSHNENREPYTSWFLLNCGGDRALDELAMRAASAKSWRYSELEAKYLEYKEIYARLRKAA